VIISICQWKAVENSSSNRDCESKIILRLREQFEAKKFYTAQLLKINNNDVLSDDIQTNERIIFMEHLMSNFCLY